MRSEPPGGSSTNTPYLLLVDHLEWVTEHCAGLLLYLDDEHAAASPKDEVELVAADASIRFEESVAAESIVPEGDSLAPVHAASPA
jgi:hypothetical protein